MWWSPFFGCHTTRRHFAVTSQDVINVRHRDLIRDHQRSYSLVLDSKMGQRDHSSSLMTPYRRTLLVVCFHLTLAVHAAPEWPSELMSILINQGMLDPTMDTTTIPELQLPGVINALKAADVLLRAGVHDPPGAGSALLNLVRAVKYVAHRR